MSRRYVAAGLLLALLAFVPALARGDDALWEVVQYAGVLGALGCLALVGAPLRPRDARPPTLLGLTLHRRLGWAAALGTALHVLGVLVADAHGRRYVAPSAPRYQLAGLAATVLLAVLATSSGAWARRALWRDVRRFQAWHVGLALAALAAVAVHVLATARYYGRPFAGPAYAGATVLAALSLLQPAWRADPAAPRRAVFPSGGRAVAVAVALASLVTVGAATPRPGAALREAPAGAALPLAFPHERHVAVNCIACHHNYVDRRGGDSCIACHRSARADLVRGAEARFHDFCFACHRDGDRVAGRHGPVSRCQGCHPAR
jgi:predicted CXXCH cytochrome family protein